MSRLESKIHSYHSPTEEFEDVTYVSHQFLILHTAENV